MANCDECGMSECCGADPSPSVRLARWEDGHPERRSMTTLYRDGGWSAELDDEHGRRWRADGTTRDEARTAALDQAEVVRDADH